MTRIDRARYGALYGPTVGDRLRLADTDLWLEVEEDRCVGGDEAVFGGGKTIRESMLQGSRTAAQGAPDVVITNVVVLDHWGVIRCDVGIREGRIIALGKAGNPDIADNVHPDLEIGPSTDIISGEGRILTAGGIDCHVHFICPQIVDQAVAAGMTTLIGGGTGPSEGTRATTCTPSPRALHEMLIALDELPVNVLLLGKGNTVSHEGLLEQLRAGAGGMKLHEDWGSTPAAIDACLRVADETGIQVAIHTDTLNEAGYLQSTVAAIDGRAIHAYHTEGAGGGHAPDIIELASYPNVLPSSTNPTRPHTVNTIDEHLDMLIVCHHLNPRIPEDLAFAESRIRASTIAAEDVLHDLGAISMIGSDAQAMGRVGETIIRTWQTAHAMKARLGATAGPADNARLRRYVAKYTICPAVTHGIDDARRLGRGRQARRPRALGPGVLRDPAAARHQGRRDRVGADGRCERVDPDAAAGAVGRDVRGQRAARRAQLDGVRLAARRELGRAGRARPRVRDRGRRATRAGSARPTCPRTPRARRSASSPTRSRCSSTGRRSSRSRSPSCRWPSATSCSEHGLCRRRRKPPARRLALSRRARTRTRSGSSRLSPRAWRSTTSRRSWRRGCGSSRSRTPR